MEQSTFSNRHTGLIVTTIVAFAIGLICMTAGYLVNRNYNAQFWETKCTFTAYNFQPFPWNNWNCRGCTAYHASITTQTSDGRIWYTHQANVYPPGNSVDRQTQWYQMHWPIGATTTCYQTDCCSTNPIFELMDVPGPFWTGIVFFSIGALIITGLVIAYLYEKRCCCRRRQYNVLSENSSDDLA